jgi:hypothetical protein
MDVIYAYTRQEAIEDGVLIDVSKMAREAGLKYPTAVTSSLWEKYIKPSENDKKKYHQSVEGRLWDVLWMFSLAAMRCSRNTLLYKVIFVVRGRQKTATLKAVIGPGDDMDPVVTIMLPEED